MTRVPIEIHIAEDQSRSPRTRYTHFHLINSGFAIYPVGNEGMEGSLSSQGVSPLVQSLVFLPFPFQGNVVLRVLLVLILIRFSCKVPFIHKI